MDHKGRKIRKIRKIIRGVLFWLLVVILIASIFLTISFSVTYYRLLLEIDKPLDIFFLDLPYFFSKFEKLPLNAKQNFLSFVINLLILLNTLLTTAVTIASQIAKEKKLERNTGIQKVAIASDKKGIDDVKIMNDEFRGASRVIIFAGDFDWIISPIIKSTAVSLAKSGKLQLFSDELDIKTIKKTLKDDYVSFESCIRCFGKHDMSPKIRCSLVEKDNNYKFLYSQTLLEDGVEQNYVFIVRRYKEGQYLIDILNALIVSLRTEYEKATV